MPGLVICKLRKEYSHTWHQVPLIKPGVTKQHRTQLKCYFFTGPDSASDVMSSSRQDTDTDNDLTSSAKKKKKKNKDKEKVRSTWIGCYGVKYSWVIDIWNMV